MIKALINVEAPRQQVYDVLTAYDKYAAWLPNCTGAVVTARTSMTADTDLTINMMKTMTMSLRFEADGVQGLSFKLLKASDLKEYAGSYRLMDAADGKGTVVITEMEIDAGAMVPGFMVSRMAKKAIEDTGKALREYIKKLPPPAKPEAAKAAAPVAPAAAAAPRAKRSRRIMTIRKTASGYNIWHMGREYDLRG